MFLSLCTLCRRRHKVQYADLRIMPISLANARQEAALASVMSA
jgi:hypothetical protein